MKNKGSITDQIKAVKRSIKKYGPGNDNSKLVLLKELEAQIK